MTKLTPTQKAIIEALGDGPLSTWEIARKVWPQWRTRKGRLAAAAEGTARAMCRKLVALGVLKVDEEVPQVPVFAIAKVDGVQTLLPVLPLLKHAQSQEPGVPMETQKKKRPIVRYKCPHCGEQFAAARCPSGMIPTHDFPLVARPLPRLQRPTRAVCPGSGQTPRSPAALEGRRC